MFRATQPASVSHGQKQINDPKMTLNFLIWVGGVLHALPGRIPRAFRLEDFLTSNSRFAKLASQNKKMAPFLGPLSQRGDWVGVLGKATEVPSR
jgi:hypothetical protein